MNETQARALVVEALADVAPEIDPDEFDADTSLRDGADLDSMDFLAYIAAVSEAMGVDIPGGRLCPARHAEPGHRLRQLEPITTASAYSPSWEIDTSHCRMPSS